MRSGDRDDSEYVSCVGIDCKDTEYIDNKQINSHTYSRLCILVRIYLVSLVMAVCSVDFVVASLWLHIVASLYWQKHSWSWMLLQVNALDADPDAAAAAAGDDIDDDDDRYLFDAVTKSTSLEDSDEQDAVNRRILAQLQSDGCSWQSCDLGRIFRPHKPNCQQMLLLH